MKKKAKIGTVLCCSTALVSILGGYLLTRDNLFNFNNNAEDVKEMNNNNLETSIEVENMSVKHMNTIYNRNGSTSYVYSYSVSPEGATHKGVYGLLSFVDGTEGVENYITFSIDQTNKTFTITKIADFSHQAQLVITANADPNVSATITIDCKQHFLGYNSQNEKTYRHLLTDNASLEVDDVKDDGATFINATNFSPVYTIASTQHWEITSVNVSNLKYMTGTSLEGMVDTNHIINESFALNDIDFTEDFSLSDLVDIVYADSSIFSDANVYNYSNRAYFGVGFDFTFVYLTSGISRTLTVHVVAAASTSDLNFGMPTSITVEEDAVVFEDVTTLVRFVYTDANDEVTYFDAQSANNTGWLSSPYRKFTGGYINLEITRIFEGNIITGPTLLYSENDGKGFFCGNETTKHYVVYNPGPYDYVHWNAVKTEFTSDFVMINNYTSSNY